MPAFLVETFVPRGEAPNVLAASRRAREAAEELARSGATIRYVRATFLPEEETCFHLFEAESASIVEEASSRAGLGRTRVLAAFDTAGEPSVPSAPTSESARRPKP